MPRTPASPASPDSAALVRHDGPGMGRARAWATMPDGERRRLATAAAHGHDTAALQEIADAWLTLYGKAGATVSAHTRRNYTHGIGALVDAWREENLLKPGRNAAALWLREMEDTGLTPSTVKVRLAAARALYAALRWTGATEANPFMDARPAREKTAAWDKRAPFTQTELRVMLDDLSRTIATALPAARTMARYDVVLVLLGAHAGLRASEMMDLRWADVDLSARRIVVAKGKGGKRRTVAMSGSLAAALGEISETMRGEHVLPYRSRHSAWVRLRNLTRRVGIKRHGLHRLRHAAGTRMMAETHDLREVAELLGHAQLDTARVYAQWADERQQQTVGAW